MIRLGLVVTLLAAAAVSVAAPAAADPDPGSFVSLTPTRILDTRDGTGAVPARPVPADGSITVHVTDLGGVPSDGVSAVAFNLTRTDAAANGYVAAYPAGASSAGTSVLNGLAGQARAHEVVIAPGTGGRVTLVNGSPGPVDLVADVSGYYTSGAPTAGGQFAPLTPQRVYDTRTTKTPLPRTTPRYVQVTGRGGVPSSGVGTVLVNVTVTGATASGYLAVDAEAPLDGGASGSNVNFPVSTSISNLAAVPVDTGGRIALSAHFTGGGHVNVVVDVFGWYAAGAPGAVGRTGGLPETRVYDSRVSGAGGTIPARGSRTVHVAAVNGVPAGVGAVVLNTTVPAPASNGYLTVYPSDAAQPLASTVNYATGATIANTVLVPLGADGAVTIYNGSGRPQHVLLDVLAYVGPVAGPYTWSGRTPAADTSGNTKRLSCAPGTTFCASYVRGKAQVYDGTSWSTPVTVADQLSGLDCVSATFCMAMAEDVEAEGDPGLDAIWNGTGWTTGVVSGLGFASGVSCVSATSCLAVGTPATGSDTDTVYGWLWDGSTWTRTSTTGLDDNFGGGPQVSCTSATFCLTADGLGHSAVWDGSGWHSVGQAAIGGAVSCTGPTFCVVAGQQRGGDFASKAQVFDGTAYTAATTIGPYGTDVVGLDCSAQDRCAAALRGTGYPVPYTSGLAFYDGAGWTATTPVDPAAAIDDVSCPATGRCVVVDNRASLVGTA